MKDQRFLFIWSELKGQLKIQNNPSEQSLQEATRAISTAYRHVSKI